VILEFSRDEYWSRIKWMMLSRVVLVTFLLGSLLFFQYRYHIYEYKTSSLLSFAATVYALSAFYAFLLRSFRNLPALAYVQIAGDSALISWLVSITGGIDSGFSILYHVSIISASIILYRRGGYFSASLASILYGGMLDLQYYDILGFVRSQNFTAGQVLFLLFVNILSFYLVAFLSSFLSERLRTARQELREKSLDFDDLRVLQDHILRSVGSGIVTMDMQGGITSWNNAAEQITGYDIDAIRDRWKSVFGESIKGLFGKTDELRSHPVRFEGRITKQSGSTAILGFTASLLKDDQEQVRGIILTFQDITLLIEMEERIRRQERLATVGSLAAGIAHEIRNPLASLSGSIQMLREGMHLSEDNRQLMEIVLRETDRLNTIITEFLEYARPRSSQQIMISLASLMQETIVLFRNSREFHEGIVLDCRIDPGLEVSGDPQRLRQVFWNLLINASQAIRTSGSITITAYRDEGAGVLDETIIMVSDTGTGIGPEDLEKIFDPFFTTKTHGTGLGLAIVYRIIEDHGGSLSVSSEPGKGTTFTIRIPAMQVQSLASPTASPPRTDRRISS
jgi:two-component system sensor histidine kinase PilS (NtrC family)